MPSVQGFREVPTYELEIFVAVSAVIQTIVFGYHFSVYDCKYENPKWLDCVSLFLLVFFILAILITTLGYEWTTIDLTIYAFDAPAAQHMIYYVGICLLYIGNALFIWIEYHLHFGKQSPWINNNINMHRINVDIIELKVKDVDTEIKDEHRMNEKLVRSGPFVFCRHPIVPIMLVWEFGYGLATGAWFEFLAFFAFVAVELFHIVSIEKSLLHHYGKEYYKWMSTKNAFCPTICCGKICEMGLFNQNCVCLCRFGDFKHRIKRIFSPKVNRFPHVDSMALIRNKHRVNKASYGSTHNAINEHTLHE